MYYDDDFEYEEEQEGEEETEVCSEWSEDYLNTLGMSMSDF